MGAPSVEDLASNVIDLFVAYQFDYEDDKLAKDLAVSEIRDRTTNLRIIEQPACCDPQPVVQWQHARGCALINGE